MLRKRRLSNAVCPRCGSRKRQLRNGKNQSGSRRVRCKACGRYYTLRKTPYKYTNQKKLAALRLVWQGQFVSLRAVAKQVRINHQTLRNWIVQDLRENPTFYQSYRRQLGLKSKLLESATSKT